ncbi:MAG: V-type ATPase 116kDa subunit family protein [Niameybacter sp.]|uniref:V-type ATP synthase subunit I n=1 Tax=Niameybacter sp. TaxID=2033640 RepID=UPI002FCB93CF
MAIEKMVLLNLVGSLDDEHAILEELVLSESIHLNMDHNDVYDNNYMVHQYEAMMPQDAMPIIENYAQMEAEYEKMLEDVKIIAEGVGIASKLDKVNVGRKYSFEDAKRELGCLKADVWEKIESINAQKARLKELKNFKQKVSCIKAEWSNFSDLHELNYFDFQVGMLSYDNKIQIKKNYENISAIILKIGDIQDSREDIYLVVYPRQFKKETKRLLKSLNWVSLKIPEDIITMSESLKEATECKIEEIQGDVNKLEQALLTNLDEKILILNKIFTRVKIEQKILKIKEEIVHGNNLFVMNAWIAKKNQLSIEEKIGDITDKFVVIAKDANELDKKVIPPTKLKNNWLFKPFEMIVQLYGLPSYHEIDPTPFLAITFMLMFGIMFGDIGQGLIYFLAGLFIYKKSAVAGGILTRLGSSSIVFGFVYGSLFGLEHEQLPWLPHIVGSPLAKVNIMPILIAGVVFGVVVLSVSYIIGIINALRRGDVEDGVFGKNGIAGYIFFMGFVGTLVALFGVIPVSPFVPLGIMGIMLVIMILKEPLTNMIKREKPYIHGEVGSYFIESIFEGVETILGALSNGISFIRVGAFALNHAGLFMAFLVMSDMTDNFVLKLLILIIGNILILTLEGLVVFIQGLRLQYYEMFSKYFTGDGESYAPIRIED